MRAGRRSKGRYFLLSPQIIVGKPQKPDSGFNSFQSVFPLAYRRKERERKKKAANNTLDPVIVARVNSAPGVWRPPLAEGGVHPGAGAAEEAVLGHQGGRHRGQLLPPVRRRPPPLWRRRGRPPAGEGGSAAGRGEVT